MARRWSEPQRVDDLHDRQQDRGHTQGHRGERQVLAQQDVSPRCRAHHERPEAVAVEAELIAHQLQHAEQHDAHPADGDQRPQRLGEIWRCRSNIEPKMKLMITGVNNIIFASGDRTSERKPPSAIDRNRLRKAGRWASTIKRPASGRLVRGAVALVGRPIPVRGLTLIQSDRGAVRPPETDRPDRSHSQ